MPMNGSFNAQEYAPKQVGTTHPVGKFPAKISNTSIEPTKEGNGGMFIVEFTTQAGSIIMRYNLWNPSETAVKIAQGQLSALCHATGVFKLDWQNDGAAIRNAQCQIEVVDQIDKQTKLPNGYTQVAKVYDINGNEPGKPPSQPQMAAQQQAPQNPAPQSAQSWQQPQQQPQNQPAQSWGAPTNNAGAPSAGQPAAWQPGPSAAPGNAPAPPWASK